MFEVTYLIFLLLWHTDSSHHFPLLFHTSLIVQFAGRDHSFRRSFWCFQNISRIQAGGNISGILEWFKFTFKLKKPIVLFFHSLIHYNWTVWLILTFGLGRVIKPLSLSTYKQQAPPSCLLLTYTQNLLLTLFDILCICLCAMPLCFQSKCCL